MSNTDESSVLQVTARLFEVEVTPGTDMREQLKGKINYLILNDFNRLVSLLYRIDVDEDKLKARLKENLNKDAAEIICEMIIERQRRKM